MCPEAVGPFLAEFGDLGSTFCVSWDCRSSGCATPVLYSIFLMLKYLIIIKNIFHALAVSYPGCRVTSCI